MFGLFKKKKSDHQSDVALLKQIFKELGDNFTNFQNQLEAGLIVGSKKTDKPVPGYTSFAYDVDVLNRAELWRSGVSGYSIGRRMSMLSSR